MDKIQASSSRRAFKTPKMTRMDTAERATSSSNPTTNPVRAPASEPLQIEKFNLYNYMFDKTDGVEIKDLSGYDTWKEMAMPVIRMYIWEEMRIQQGPTQGQNIPTQRQNIPTQGQKIPTQRQNNLTQLQNIPTIKTDTTERSTSSSTATTVRVPASEPQQIKKFQIYNYVFNKTDGVEIKAPPGYEVWKTKAMPKIRKICQHACTQQVPTERQNHPTQRQNISTARQNLPHTRNE